MSIPWSVYSQLLIPEGLGLHPPCWVRGHRNLVKGELPSSEKHPGTSLRAAQPSSAHSRTVPCILASFVVPSPLTPTFFSLSDDPLFCLLHLWTDRGHLEFPVPPGSDQEDLFPLPSASRLHVSCVHWDWRLHPLFMAHLPASQLRTEEDVLRKGALAASLSWNGWESEFCAFSSHCSQVMKTAVKSRWIHLQP